VAPHDEEIITEVRKITSVNKIKFNGNKDKIKSIGKETDELFLNEGKENQYQSRDNKKFASIPIVYTPIHGTGITLVPAALKMFGFKNIISVPEQMYLTGNFPTVKSPNPEEPDALKTCY